MSSKVSKSHHLFVAHGATVLLRTFTIDPRPGEEAVSDAPLCQVEPTVEDQPAIAAAIATALNEQYTEELSA